MFLEIICVCFCIFASYFFIAKFQQNSMFIDGPKGLPVFGCILEFGHENMYSKFWTYAEKYGEIFLVKMLWENVIVLNSSQLIKKAFSDKRYRQQFNDRPDAFYGQYFLTMSQTVGSTKYGSAAFHRNAKQQFIHALRVYGPGVTEFEDLFMVEIDKFIKEIEQKDGSLFNCQEIIDSTLSNTLSILLSGDSKTDFDRNMFWDHADGADFFLNANVNVVMLALPVLRFLPGKYSHQFRSARKAFEKLKKYFQNIQADFKPGETRGLINNYLEYQRQEKSAGEQISFTDDKIVGQLAEVAVGGMLTIRSMLTNSILVLLNHPEYQSRIQTELDFHIRKDRYPILDDMKKCIFLQAFEIEMERYLNAVPLLLPHFCRDKIKLEDYEIAANTTVIANVWYVHHDPKVWGDPWTFRPERFLDHEGNLLPQDHLLRKSVLTFGYGRRSCPGELFGRTRNMLYIAAILQRCNLEFPPGQSMPCDPSMEDIYEMKFTIRAKHFLCRTIKRT